MKRFGTNSSSVILGGVLGLCWLASWPSSAADQEFVIGMTAPLTGPLAEFGTAFQKATLLVVEEVNAAGGIPTKDGVVKLRLNVLDDANSADRGLANIRRLVQQDGAKAAFSLSGPVASAIAPFAEGRKVPHMTASWMVPDPQWRYTFPIVAAPPQFSGGWSWVAKNMPDIKRVATFVPDDAVGQWTEVASRVNARKAGLEVVAQERFTRGSTDLTAPLRRLLTADPQAIDFGGSGAGNVGLAVRQLRELGYKGGFADFGATSTEIVGKLVGGINQIEGYVSGGYAQVGLPDTVHSWEQKYTARFGRYQPESSDRVNGILALEEALRKSGSVDPEVIRDTLAGLKFKSIWGEAAFVPMEGEKNAVMVTYPVPLCKVKDGVCALVSMIPTVPNIIKP
ncbi:amino acid/amide ABC transporter substrate-binding protein, HAAT family [Rhizobiales bacterium GAS113]|nr:amino acid/amide ABC transporter substrate-binding protein, HAAT family [Rhizobiales bacterium GAS113]